MYTIVAMVPIYVAPDSESNVRFACQGRIFIGVITIADIIGFILESLRDADEGAEDVIEVCLNRPIEDIKGITPEADLELDLSIERSDTRLEEVLKRMSEGFYLLLM